MDDGYVRDLTEDEQIMSALINERGYIVAIVNVPARVGDPIPNFTTQTGRRLSVDQPFRVIAATDEEDYKAQGPIFQRFGKPLFPFLPGVYYYRIGTD